MAEVLLFLAGVVVGLVIWALIATSRSAEAQREWETKLRASEEARAVADREAAEANALVESRTTELEEAGRRADSLQQQLEAVEAERDASAAEAAEAGARAGEAEAALAGRDQELTELRTSHDEAQSRIDALTGQQETAASAAEDAGRTIADLQSTAADREREASEARASLAAVQSRIEALTAEAETSRSAAAGAEDVAAERSQLAARVAELEPIAGSAPDLIEKLKASRAETEDLRRRLADCEAASVAAEPEPEPVVDDLTKIKGIGPVFVRLLNEQGYTSFRQIAAIADEETAGIEEALDTLPDRIEREQWREQARDLHAQKYGEPL